MYKTIEKHADRLFIISMLTLVMIVAFAFKKPNNHKIETGASLSTSLSSVEYNQR
jgi:hypothetical protein